MIATVYVTDPSEPIERIVKLLVSEHYPLAEGPETATVVVRGVGFSDPRPRLDILTSHSGRAISKPFSPDELLDTITALLREQAAPGVSDAAP